MKLTKRKGFNFFRSYYDVYNELSDEDKVKFMDALLDRQFQGIKPTALSGMSNFAYISQTNSIDSQVKGFEDKTGIKLSPDPIDTPTVPPTVGGPVPPPVQVEVEVEVEGKGKGEEEVKEKKQLREIDNNLFLKFWEVYDKKTDRPKCEKRFNNLKQSQKEKIIEVVESYVKSTPDKKYRKNPSTWLNNECWNDEIINSTPQNSNDKFPTNLKTAKYGDLENDM